ncbi:MAG: hypothetical protein FWG64_03120 [Firmicutes bacterium]|nr:hypothetical protein [Bacillota bacterium]
MHNPKLEIFTKIATAGSFFKAAIATKVFIGMGEVQTRINFPNQVKFPKKTTDT